MVKISDDAPKGNYHKLIATGAKKKVNAKASFAHAGKNLNTWILFVQYACSFGVELTMNNAAALYFRDTLGESVESAAAIASIFGFMNLFARGLGGYLSDRVNKKYSMRGRLWVQIGLMAIEGALIIVFSRTNDLAGAIITMTIFSIFVQACEGSTYSIVPYVDPPNSGSISGIVGAGGNMGAVGEGE
jgi:NNP family nitrate/nitrite transporter-like MFS transporter